MIKNIFLVILSIISISLICISLYFYTNTKNLSKLIDVENIKSKQLENEIIRASTQFIRKDDILLDNNNLDIIKRDLESLQSEIKAVNILLSKSNEQVANNIKSSNVIIKCHDCIW